MPWAIGSPEGGHDAVHPDLGTLEDFDCFVARARELGMEIALDFALQCSPDHPWVQKHPEWFHHRADGTIAYAENPPKKYQDIYPIAFDADMAGLVAETVRVLRHWMDHGVRIFRVDNPHTKPVVFWEKVIADINRTDPDVIFLAEAFTRPAMMHTLAPIGFQQSYTYFTWRNTKARADRVPHRAVRRRRLRTCGPTSSPTPPTSCTSTSSTAAARPSRCAPCSPPPSPPPGASTPATNSARTTPLREGSEEYLELGEVPAPAPRLGRRRTRGPHHRPPDHRAQPDRAAATRPSSSCATSTSTRPTTTR